MLASLIPEPYWLRKDVTRPASQGSGLGPPGFGAGLAAAGAAGLAAAGAVGFSPVAGAAGLAGPAGLAAVVAAAAGLTGSAVLAAGGASALAAGALGAGTVGAAELGDVSADALAPDPAPSPDTTGAPAGEAGSGETGSVSLVSSGTAMPLLRYPCAVVSNLQFVTASGSYHLVRRSRHTVTMITLFRESNKLASECRSVSMRLMVLQAWAASILLGFALKLAKDNSNGAASRLIERDKFVC